MTPKPKLFTDWPNHDVREPLPYMPSHQEWCRWLKRLNQLSWQHRPCLESDRCEAAQHRYSVPGWRTRSPIST